MEHNPYEVLAGTFGAGRTAALAYRLGRVTALEPLTVSVAGVEVSSGLLVNAGLLPGAGRQVSLQGTMTVPSAMGPLTGDVSGEGLALTAGDAGLAAGDSVLLLSGDDQTFILICKVVSP